MHPDLFSIGGWIEKFAPACGKQPKACRFTLCIPLYDSGHILYPPHHRRHGHGFPDKATVRVETQCVEPVTVSVCLEDSRGESLGIARHNRSIEGQVVIRRRCRWSLPKWRLTPRTQQ